MKLKHKHKALEVKVWGNKACFTRPESKVERVSYPVMTPSAARGVLESILWKPEFYWRVKEIQVLNPIRHFSIVRNEQKHKISARTILKWQQKDDHYLSDAMPGGRTNMTQRFTLGLKDVAYIIKADIVLKPGVKESVTKYREIFKRRVKKGQCFKTPYLGCREFTAFFEEPSSEDSPIDLTDDLGMMLFDLKFESDKSNKGTPIFFHAKLVNGVLKVPQELYERREGNVC